jgi:hypothetical protein
MKVSSNESPWPFILLNISAAENKLAEERSLQTKKLQEGGCPGG